MYHVVGAAGAERQVMAAVGAGCRAEEPSVGTHGRCGVSDRPSSPPAGRHTGTAGRRGTASRRDTSSPRPRRPCTGSTCHTGRSGRTRRHAQGRRSRPLQNKSTQNTGHRSVCCEAIECIDCGMGYG